MKNTLFVNVLEFVNKNKIFSPSEVRYQTSDESHTVYLYINLLHKAKFIKRLERGVYERISIVPDISTTDLMKIAYKGDKSIMRKLKLKKIQSGI